jgi:chorismate synthase
MFDGVENKIASLCFGIPALKGIEFGSGFAGSRRRGSENNDPFYYDENGRVKTRTNHSGGIQGGITNGMPLVFRSAFKPTASIAQEQDTVDLTTGETVKLVIKGRHDPCIVPRAAVAVEAAASVAVLELLAESGLL